VRGASVLRTIKLNNMNYKHVSVPKPFCREFTLFAKPKDFLEEIMRQKKIEIDLKFVTKTSLHISLCINGKFSFLLAWDNPKFKFLVRDDMNYLSGERTIKYHFKLTKHQGYLELKQYIEDCLDSILKDHDGEITVEWIDSNAYQLIYLAYEQNK
jgi:hypothetical protein